MAAFGKLLVFLNLFVGVALLTWAVSLNANRTDWVDRKTDDGQVEGQITKLKKEVDRLTRSAADAQAGYGARLNEVAEAERVRDYRRSRLDARLAAARKGSFKVQVMMPDNAYVNVEEQGADILGADDKPLRGLDALVAEFEKQVGLARFARAGEQPATPAELANPPALLGDRLTGLGIEDLGKLHLALSGQIAAADATANKQKDIRANLANEADFLADTRVNWLVQLAALERRQRQLEAELAALKK